ncbi:MAG: leucine-rich repeat domain-containing protein [Thermoguttaceae bacterium]|jgi:hypothetical protein
MEIDHTPTTDRPKPKRRWFYPTPERLLVVLLVVVGLLLLSEQWFPKGWAVLIAVAAVGLFLLSMLIWFIVSLFFHWHFQFSIRSLLVLTVAFAIPSSWLAVQMKWAKEQKEAVEAIRELGEGVRYDYQFNASGRIRPGMEPAGPAWLRNLLGIDFFCNVTAISSREKNVSNTELEHLKGLTQLQSLNFGDSQIADAGLEYLEGLIHLQDLDLSVNKITGDGLVYLKGMSQLQTLKLNETEVTDARLIYLKGLTQIRMLDIRGNRITDNGLEHIRGLTQLQELWLADNQITDAGLAHLTAMTCLKWLDLSNTKITDAGLELLKGLKKLEKLDLSHTKVTAAGVNDLQNTLPNLTIYQ